MRFSTTPPTNANARASQSEIPSPAGTGGARSSWGAWALAGLGPATTDPVSGTSTVSAPAGVPVPPNPLLPVITPATWVNPGASWLATGSVSTNVPLASRRNACFAEASMRPSSYGKK